MEKGKKKGITWGEAAKIVLETAPRPLTHKEILQVILDRNLKEVKLTGAAALACINAMLHANSRTPTDIFYKLEGRNGCYRLNENRTEFRDSSVSGSESPGSSSNSVLSDTKELSQFAENMSDTLTASSDSNAEVMPSRISTFPPTNLSTATGSLPPISSMLSSYPSRVTTTTSVSVTSSVACAIADSRLTSLIAPTPDNLPPSSTMPKKRVVKPRFQGDGPSTKKPRVTFKLDKEKKEKQERPTRPPVKTKAELKYMEDESPTSKNFIPPVLRPPMYPTHTVVKTSSAGYFGQKRHKKMSIAAQVKRSKEGQVDLVSPDSILSKINVRSLINFKTFHLLPAHYQYQLVKLLPEVDRETGSRGDLRPASSAFSNEFFTSAFGSWRERLSEGEFTPEMSLKIQQEQDKLFNQDPWKTKHFESAWGEKLLGTERYVSPVEKSHQIMEEVYQEWLKEQKREHEREQARELERERLRQIEETQELSKSNKTNKKQAEGKSLTAKQKAASSRQQKPANAKSATNKAPSSQKKTADGKTSQNGAKSSSKDGQIKEESPGERVTKVNEKPKTKQTSKNSKHGKVNRPPKTVSSETKKKAADTSNVFISTVVLNKPTQEGVASCATTEGDFETKQSPLQAIPTSQNSKPEAKATVIAEEFPSIEKPSMKPTAKSSKKKVTSKPSPKVVVTKPITFQCLCMLKPMMMCRLCGAFCHSDCISSLSVCRACTV